MYSAPVAAKDRSELNVSRLLRHQLREYRVLPRKGRLVLRRPRGNASRSDAAILSTRVLKKANFSLVGDVRHVSVTRTARLRSLR